MVLDGTSPQAIAQAVARLRAGGLVGMPTETVYGLAADATNATAVARIFEAKGRPSDHPLIVHVAEPHQVAHFALEIAPFAHALMAAFWPGPLTLILPRRPEVAAAAAGGQVSVGLRCPAHPVATALLRACAAAGVAGLAAPSANRFGRVSPTTAAHVQDSFGDQLLVLDGGPCQVGIESTIVDCTRGQPVLLRPGGISRERIEAVCGQPLGDPHALEAPAPRASGTLEAHYAPDAPVRLMDAQALQTALEVLGPDARAIAVWSRAPLRSAAAGVLLRRMPDGAVAVQHELFATLRAFDTLGVRLIWIEKPPDSPEWEGVADRLQRAAAA